MKPRPHEPAPQSPAPRLLLRPQEAADALGISLRTVMGMVASNEIPFTRIGERNLRFPVDGLRDWVAKRTSWPTELLPSGPEQTPESSRISANGNGRAACGTARAATGSAEVEGSGDGQRGAADG